ncbi:hypothetical protein HKX48_005575 [Thoreauomyces humboldtii]|nr:hypothetical protein HKX48_005575 [Thoreauomyces humboldtii]
MKFTLASIVLASTVLAQNATDLNPALPASCKTSVLATGAEAFTACGISEAFADFTSLSGNVNQGTAMAVFAKLANSPTFLPALCSNACSTILTNTSAVAATSCGTVPALAPNSTDAKTLGAYGTWDMAQVLNATIWGRNLICTKDASSAYCLPAIFNSSGQTLESIYENPATACSPCGLAFASSLNNTNGLDANAVQDVQNFVAANVTSKIANCSSATTGAAGSKSGAEKVVAGTFAGVVAFAFGAMFA